MDLSVFRHEWLVFPLFGISVFFAVYMYADTILNRISKSGAQKKSEIMMHMKLLGMDVDEKKVIRLQLLSSLGVGLLFFMLVWPNTAIGLFLGTSVGIAGFQVLPIFYKTLYERRCNAFVGQMVDALTIMANGVKSGSNPQQTMARVVEIMGNPVRAEFNQVLTQTQFGQSYEEALTDLAERIPRPDVQMFVTAVVILKETGGNMAETFQTIVSTIRERQKLEKKISAMTAQGIMQGIIVSCIPFVMGIIFFILDPSFIKPMFETALGIGMLAIMLVLQIIGGIVIKKVVTIKV
ncbi:type II secretion system F family protein [Pseudobdellovibrio sp. HCB154]|uniref:type II secretion system F family protein n=1 Tax=Pseudobdellovibrio sp. HCB154 TaxID=3386277 RepID=UPI0039174373